MASRRDDVPIAVDEPVNASQLMYVEYTSMTIHIRKPVVQVFWEQLAMSLLGRTVKSILFEPYEKDYDFRSVLPEIDLRSVSFPNLEILSIQCQGIRALNMSAENFPKLKHFSLRKPGKKALEYVNFRLPHLVKLSLQFANIQDPTGFGESLSSSPKLELFYAYSLTGLGINPHLLIMPKLEIIDVNQSDGFHFNLWAPKLEYIGLLNCCGVINIHMLSQMSCNFGGPEYEFDNRFHSYTVNFTNTPRPMGNVLSLERCIGFKSSEASNPPSDVKDGQNPNTKAVTLGQNQNSKAMTSTNQVRIQKP